MTRAVEVVFEDRVLRPLCPLEGLREHEHAWVLLQQRPSKLALRRVFGTLNLDEAQEMRNVLDREFGQLEGQW